MKRKSATHPRRTKIYGSAITFYEEYPEEGLTEEQREGLHLTTKYRAKSERQIFSNKCICVLSQWPFFGAFEQFLFFLHKRQGRRDSPTTFSTLDSLTNFESFVADLT